jgi:hypothetical protein
MSKKPISRREILRIAGYITLLIAIMAMSPSIAATVSDNPHSQDKAKNESNNGLHKGWLKDHDNNGLHKGWLKDHDYNTSNDNNGNPVRAVPEPGSLLLLAIGISAIVWTPRKKR